jgi:hypothetical protein
MLRKSFFLAVTTLLLVLVTSTKAQAWGAYHVGFTHVGYGGIYHVGRTGFVGGDRYGGYGYGGLYGGYRYGDVYGGYHYGGIYSDGLYGDRERYAEAYRYRY